TATTEIYTLSLHDALPISIEVDHGGDLRNQPQIDADAPRTKTGLGGGLWVSVAKYFAPRFQGIRFKRPVMTWTLLGLFRAPDRMDPTPSEIPQRLIRQLFDLDAGYAEALWALDQPPGTLDVKAMLRDTLAALEQLPEASAR